MKYQSQYQIVSNVCRDKFSIGPSVHHSHNVTTYYSRMNSVEEYEKVVRHIIDLELQYNDGIIKIVAPDIQISCTYDDEESE